MKKTILIFALSRSPWIGGIYYRKNVVHMMLSNEKIRGKYNIVIVTNEKFRETFDVFGCDVGIETCPDGANTLAAMAKAFTCCFKYKVKYVFPLMPFEFLKLFGITPVSWIADFQHCHYPEFFTENEIQERDKNFKKIARANNPLVLSSYDALNDFRHFYKKDRKNVYVVHFSSFIDEELETLNKLNHDQILEKLNLRETEYCAICNQFWKHKNHILVLEAIKQFAIQYPDSPLKFVFTGEPNDRRDPEYINQVKTLLDDPIIKGRTKVLGFITRSEQLCVMKYAKFLIQPSLFEGWGTVVEDGKRLGKNMILSDISVHKEQMNKHCILFEHDNAESLVSAIVEMLNKESFSDTAPVDDTIEYASALEAIFIK